MKSYRLLVHEVRGGSPLELDAEMARDERVIEFCVERLARSPQIASIEVWSRDRQLCHLYSEAREAA
jgi:hypothetical protein